MEAFIRDREEMLCILAQLAGQVETQLQEVQVAGKMVTFADPLQYVQAMMPILRTLLAHLEGNPTLVHLLGVTVSGLVDQNETMQPSALQAVSL